MSREISPPAPKRRRVEHTPNTAPTTKSTASGTTLRIYSWNINGIAPFLQQSITSFFKAGEQANEDKVPKASLRDFLKRHDWPEILFLQEVKINPDDETTKRAVERAVTVPKGADSEPDYRAFFCLPSDKYNARGFGRKVYGVCSIVRQDFLSRYKPLIRTVDWDLEGRFQIIETAGRNGLPKLSIWNIYAVNGTEHEYRDPETGQVAGTRHDRKLAVHRLLLAECKKLEAAGFSVVLAGDLNVARAPLDGFPNLRTFPEQHMRNRADFNEKFFDDPEGLRAVDTFRQVQGNRRGYSFYPRNGPFGYSCDRVDLIICSAALREDIPDADTLATPAERGPSDHCPIYATFAFGGDKTSEDG